MSLDTNLDSLWVRMMVEQEYEGDFEKIAILSFRGRIILRVDNARTNTVARTVQYMNDQTRE